MVEYRNIDKLGKLILNKYRCQNHIIVILSQKHNSPLRTQGKGRKQEPKASALYIFPSQCPLYFINDKEKFCRYYF